MANANISDFTLKLQFKDYISTQERLSIYGIEDCIKKNPVTTYRSAKKNQTDKKSFWQILQGSKQSKTVLA